MVLFINSLLWFLFSGHHNGSYFANASQHIDTFIAGFTGAVTLAFAILSAWTVNHYFIITPKQLVTHIEQITQKEVSRGGIHSNKISRLMFENFLGGGGSRRVRKVSFHSTLREFHAPLKWRMLDTAVARVRVSWQILHYQWYYASCFMRKKLSPRSGLFWAV